jgi:hypothetical protein
MADIQSDFKPFGDTAVLMPTDGVVDRPSPTILAFS